MVQAAHDKENKIKMDSRTILEIIAVFISEGIALSGAFNVNASRICFLIAWGFTSLILFRRYPPVQYTRTFLLCWFVVSLAFYFSSSLLRPEVVPQYFGTLTPPTELLFSTQKEGKFRLLQIGDSCTIFKIMGPETIPVLSVFSESSLIIESINKQLKVSTKILDIKGEMIAELRRNIWKVSPPRSWDLNYTTAALEVIDTRGYVILQIRIFSDRIQIQGEWWDSTGRGLRLVKDNGPLRDGGFALILDRVNNSDPPPHIEPIFEYPSNTYLGKMRISPSASRPACDVFPTDFIR